MKGVKYLVGLTILTMITLFAGSVLAWDTRWQFKQEAPVDNSGSGAGAIEMKRKFDFNSMDKFKGATEYSSGYTVMRNLNGEIMRGYINKDGSGLLRDQNGNFYNVNTHW
jgi:hypothetical protein